MFVHWHFNQAVSAAGHLTEQ